MQNLAKNHCIASQSIVFLVHMAHPKNRLQLAPASEPGQKLVWGPVGSANPFLTLGDEDGSIFPFVEVFVGQLLNSSVN